MIFDRNLTANCSPINQQREIAVKHERDLVHMRAVCTKRRGKVTFSYDIFMNKMMYLNILKNIVK